MANITGIDIQDMVSHWLHTPANGYLGSDYGSDASALKQNPFSAGLADELLEKLKREVPALSLLPQNTVNLYGVEAPPDKLHLFVEVAGTSLSI
jgi:hypothetical protein